jgi:hypothetical protein
MLFFLMDGGKIAAADCKKAKGKPCQDHNQMSSYSGQLPFHQVESSCLEIKRAVLDMDIDISYRDLLSIILEGCR